MTEPTTADLRTYGTQFGSSRQTLGRWLAAPINGLTDPAEWPLVGGILRTILGVIPNGREVYNSIMTMKDNFISGIMSNVVLGVVDLVAPGALDSVDDFRRRGESWLVGQATGMLGDTRGTALAQRTLQPGTRGDNVQLNPEITTTVNHLHAQAAEKLGSMDEATLQRAVARGLERATMSVESAWDSVTTRRDGTAHAIHAAGQVHREIFERAQAQYFASRNIDITDRRNWTAERLRQYQQVEEPQSLAFAKEAAEAISGVRLLRMDGNTPVYEAVSPGSGIYSALLPHTQAIAGGATAPAPEQPRRRTSLEDRTRQVSDAGQTPDQRMQQLAEAALETPLMRDETGPPHPGSSVPSARPPVSQARTV